MTRNIKFINLIASRKMPDAIVNCLNEQPARSGAYNWLFAHKGQIGSYWDYKDRLDEFDVVQVNMSPADMMVIPEIRNRLENSSTKLVVNNDYVCEYWGKWPGIHPFQYDQIQKLGDMVFATEPYQASNMINGTYTLPHPSKIDMLKKFSSDQESNSMGFIYHWWAGDTYLPHRTCEIAKKMFGIDRAKIYGYGPGDQCQKFSKMMWDEVAGLKSFPEFAQEIQGERVVYDPNPMHTYGRNGVELACFRKPVVGSDRVLSYRMLFPELACDPYDAKAALEKMKIALDPKLVEPILDKAHEKVEFFNYKNSRDRWFKAFDEAIDRGGHKWYRRNG